MPSTNRLLKQRHQLPLDHPKRAELTKLIDAEYAEANKLEFDFRSKWNADHRLNDLIEAKQVVDFLCGVAGISQIKKVYFDNEPWSGGSYSFRHRSISLRNDHNFTLVILIHELAHHLTGEPNKCIGAWGTIKSILEPDHGPTYLKCLKFLFDHLLALQEKYGPERQVFHNQWYSYRTRYSALELLKREAIDNESASSIKQNPFLGYFDTLLAYLKL